MDNSVFDNAQYADETQQSETSTALVAQGVANAQLQNISTTLQDAAAQNDLIAETIAPQVQDFFAHDLERKLLGKLDLGGAIQRPKLEIVNMEEVKAMLPSAPSITVPTLPQSLSPSAALLPGVDY